MQRLAAEPFDLLVVGGGITGSAVARDAAMRGLRVALVERSDFASGTSSKSSKMIHGGLRYLENLEFGLVFESTRERWRQRKLNPHLVRPLPFLFPVYRTDKNGLFKINAGLWLYDTVSLFRSERRHRRLGRDATVAAAPGLLADNLAGSVHYFDCSTDDARLTLANALDAQRHGAAVANYLSFARPKLSADGQVCGACLVDELTGAELEVSCRQLAYAAGAWTDSVPEAPGAGALLRPTKGVHVVVPRARLTVDLTVVMSAVADGRVVFAVPMGPMTYVGTTDTDYTGDLDAVRATAEDVDYLLTTVNRFFPAARLTPDDVKSTWAGLRPLIRDDAVTAYRTSREHHVHDDPRGITTIAGGKLTTYRSMAKEVVDTALARLRKRGAGVTAGKCTTHKVGVDAALPPEPTEDFEAFLWQHHGSGAAWVRERITSHPAEAAGLVGGLPYVLAQVSYAVLFERAQRLDDVLVRRTQVFYRDADQGLGCAALVARHMAMLMGTDEAWTASEVSRYAELVELSRRGARALTAVAVAS